MAFLRVDWEPFLSDLGTFLGTIGPQGPYRTFFCNLCASFGREMLMALFGSFGWSTGSFERLLFFGVVHGRKINKPVINLTALISLTLVVRLIYLTVIRRSAI